MLFLCLFPLQWVKIISIGGGSLKAAHLALLIPFVMLWLKRKVVLPTGGLVSILALHPLLFASLLFALPFSENPGAGLQIIIRMSAYYAIGVVILVWLHTMTLQELMNTLSKSVFYVATTFYVVFGYYTLLSGVNIPKVFASAVASGQPNFIQYHLFVTVMNKGRLDGLSAEESIEAAGRHGIMIFLVLIFFCRVLFPKVGETRLQSLIGRVLLLSILAIVLVSLSRVALLVLLSGALMVFIYRALLSKVSNLTYLAIAVTFSFSILYLLFGEQGRVATILYEKLIVDVVDNPRATAFVQIIDDINLNSFFGAGTGTQLSLLDQQTKFPHNLVLFWWYQAGFIGLLLSLLTMSAFLFCCVKLCFLAVNAKGFVNGQVYLVAAIFLVPPIVRMLVAKQGALALTEWIAVAFAVVLGNLAMRERATRQSDQSFYNKKFVYE